MARLEWEWDNQGGWYARSGAHDFAVWAIEMQSSGLFRCDAPTNVIERRNELFTTFSGANAWCQQREDELCQKT